MADEIRLAQETITDLANAIRGGNSSPPQSAAPAAAPAAAAAPTGLPTAGLVNALISALEKLTSTITGSKVADTFSETTQIATAFGGLKDASNLASGAISKLAGEIPYLGAALKKAGLDLNEELQLARTASQRGVGQGDTSDLRDRALAAGFKSVQEYIEYLKSSYGNNLRTIGKTSEDSAQKLGEVAANVVKSKEGQNLLSRNLMTSDQLAQIAGIASEGKSQMLKSAEGRQALAEEAARLAVKIDAQSKVTGQSVDEIINDRKQRQASVEEQLRLQSLTNDQQRLQYTQNQQLAATQGKSMQDVIGQIQVGGRLSKDQQQMLQAATGGRGGQLIQLIREQKRTAGLAAEDPRRIEADNKLKDFMAKMSAYQASPEFARRANTTSNQDQAAAYRKLQDENKEKYAIRNIMQESGVTAPEAKRRAEEFGLQQGRGLRQEGLYNEKQVPNVGAKPYEMLAEANEQARKTAVSLAGEFNRLNNSLGRNSEALDKVREYLNLAAGPKGQTQEQRDAMVRDYVNSITSNAAGAVPGTDEATGQPVPIQTTNMNVTATGPVTITPATSPNPNEGTPTTPATAKPEGSRAHGTEGETGQKSEPKDAVLQIHKGETVLTPEQKEAMIKDSANSVFDKILGKKAVNGSEDQNVQYQQVDKNDPAFVKMRQDNAAEQAERSKFMRSREVADPMYAGGKRFEMYDTRDDAKNKQSELKVELPKPAPVKEQPKVELPKPAPVKEQPKVELPKPAPVKEQPKVELPKVAALAKPNQDAALAAQNAELKKYAAQGDTMGTAEPSRIRWKNENGKLQKTFENQAEKMLGEQTQGAFSNLRTAFSKRQQPTGPNITEEFKNYQPKGATVTQPSQAAIQIPQPKLESKETITLKDLNDQLMMLNKSIAQLVHSSTTNGSLAEQQVRVTKKLSGNRFG